MLENSVYFKNSLNVDYCTLRYLAHNRMISAIWKGTAPDDSIRAVKDSLVQMIREKDCIVILNDIEQLFSAEAALLSELGDSHWDEEISQLGIRYLVHVLKPDTEIPADDGQTKCGLTIRYFHSKFDALAWIKEKLRGEE